MKFNLGLDKENYRIDFTVDGKRNRFYPDTPDKLIAKKLFRRIKFNREQGEFDFIL